MKAVASSSFSDYRTDGETRRTQWTLIFDQSELTVELYRWENWGQPYLLKLKENPWR